MLVSLCVLVITMVCIFFFFFFKQKTAYEMRISDWSSDVCSSDLDHGCGSEVGPLWFVLTATARGSPLHHVSGSRTETRLIPHPLKHRWRPRIVDATAAVTALCSRNNSTAVQGRGQWMAGCPQVVRHGAIGIADRKSTRLNSSH